MTTTKIWPTMPHIWQSIDHDDTWSSYDDLITMAEDRGICGILLAWSLFMGEEDTRRYSDNLDTLWDSLTRLGKENVIDCCLMFHRDFLRGHWQAWLDENGEV